MKYLMQLLIILLFSFLGELLHSLIPLPIPASIYGMVLMFGALLLKIIRPEQVKETGSFLTGIMAVMFVSPAVGLLSCWDTVKEKLVPILVIIVVSLLLTFFVSGKLTQLLLKKEDGESD